MGRGTSKASGGGGAKVTTQAAQPASGAPALDPNLIQRANAAGTFVDYGDSTARQYQKNVSEIQKMDMTDTERQDAYNQLHLLTEAQLNAEASARGAYAPGMGPARFNSRQMVNNANNAVNARAKVDSFMYGLRKQQKQKAKQTNMKNLAQTMQQAIQNGALSFTFNGKTYTRKSKRSKTFVG